MEIDAAARGHIAHRIEGLVIGDDVEHIAGPRARQPDARRDRDAEIAPVLHPEGRRGVHQLRPVPRQQTGGVVADHAPVADRHEARLPVEGAEPEVLEHTRDVLDAARVLDVEDDGAPHRRRAPVGTYHTGTTERLSQVELTRPSTITSRRVLTAGRPPSATRARVREGQGDDDPRPRTRNALQGDAPVMASRDLPAEREAESRARRRAPTPTEALEDLREIRRRDAGAVVV